VTNNGCCTGVFLQEAWRGVNYIIGAVVAGGNGMEEEGARGGGFKRG